MSNEMTEDSKSVPPANGEARSQQFTAVNNSSSSTDTPMPSSDALATNGATTSVFGGPSPSAAASTSTTTVRPPPIVFNTGNAASSSVPAAAPPPNPPQAMSPTSSLLEISSSSNGLIRERSVSDSPPRAAPAPPPTDDTWMSGTADVEAGQQKRKRSISPTTQTTHHHLAAHEAQMGAASMTQTPQRSNLDEGLSATEEDRSVRGATIEESSPHPQTIQIDPRTGVGVDTKRRKRVFSNRTKTGCITCRRRKKKCDEGKPECTNCKRGGFVCEGYSGKVSWQKPPGKQIPPAVLTGPPYIVAKDDPSGSPTPSHPHGLPAGTPTSIRVGMDSQDALSPQNTPGYLPLRGDSTAQATPTSAGSQAEGLPASAGGDRRVSFSHQALAAATGSVARTRSEKEKMVNSELYHANDPGLTAEREACKAACWRYNNIAGNPNNNISEAEKGRLLLDILRPGNKWEVVNTGAAPGTPGAVTYVSENGFTSDIVDVTVDSPFNCSYGYNIRLGKNVYIEAGCTILDSCAVTIKARTILSPSVSIYSATHPIDPRKRNGSKGPEMAKPVLIEEDCWLGGNVTILGGITIGKGSVVGAGSVVTRDVPPFTVVAGNPARVIRGIYQNGVDM